MGSHKQLYFAHTSLSFKFRSLNNAVFTKINQNLEKKSVKIQIWNKSLFLEHGCYFVDASTLVIVFVNQ